MSTKHFFFAVPLPPKIKEHLYNCCENMKKNLSFKRWVYQEDYHITLAFLGQADHLQLDKAISFIKRELADTFPFDLQINGLGTFGRKESPRIFWADILQSLDLNNLRDKVYSACIEAGFTLDTRPFSPHITLARKWDESYGPFSKDMLNEETIQSPIFQVNNIVLYETKLESIPKYHTKAVIQLDGHQ